MDSAFAKPSPEAKSSRKRVITDWVKRQVSAGQDDKSTFSRLEKGMHLGADVHLVKPALARESDAITNPSRVMMPRQ
jgi:hypothetical protein